MQDEKLFNPGIKSDLEEALEKLPDEVSKALLAWRKATLDRETLEAKLYTQFKNSEEKRTGDEIKSLVRDNAERYDAVLKEATKESDYTRLNERLMAFKRLAAHRAAF